VLLDDIEAVHSGGFRHLIVVPSHDFLHIDESTFCLSWGFSLRAARTHFLGYKNIVSDFSGFAHRREKKIFS
jgi:purine-cytosine permease-like protein